MLCQYGFLDDPRPSGRRAVGAGDGTGRQYSGRYGDRDSRSRPTLTPTALDTRDQRSPASHGPIPPTTTSACVRGPPPTRPTRPPHTPPAPRSTDSRPT